MKNDNKKGYAILGILLVLTSVIAFVVPTEKTSTFWIAYVFTVVSFAAQILTWKTALGRDETIKGKFLGFPVVLISSIYLIVQLIVFAVFLIVPTFPAWSAVTICSLILGIFAVCMISGDIGRSEVEQIDAKTKSKVFYIRELQTNVEIITAAEKEDATKKELEKLLEKIRFSDPISDKQLTELETQIAGKVDELKMSDNKLKIISELNLLLDERNRKCRLLK